MPLFYLFLPLRQSEMHKKFLKRVLFSIECYKVIKELF